MAIAEAGEDRDRLRESERARKRRERLAETVVIVPQCEDKERRILLESDDIEWLQWYFGDGCGLTDPFTYAFTSQQQRMIRAMREAIVNGGDQAIAASRGEGKTTLAERLVTKFALSGEIDYTVIFSATGGMADDILDSIKTALAFNERLAADYPEVCTPVKSLEGAPQRANTQRCNGVRFDTGEPYELAESRFSWCGQEVIFPTLPGSPSSGAIIATRGLEAAVRGLKKRGKRPKLAIIDDPDTEDTARSEEQAKKLETRLDRAIGGLGGQRRAIGRVMLTTLQSRTAVSYRFTDPSQKPTWKGERFRYLVQPPTRLDLWQEYVQNRLLELQERDDENQPTNPYARRSHAWYLEHREEMDAGSVVANPHRYDPTPLPDGSQMEASALQHYYNEVARIGPEAVATEYDNDPPEEMGPAELGVTPQLIQRQLSGYPRGVVPPGCTVLSQGIDVGKWNLHWVVRAWQPDGTGYTIDYGTHAVSGSKFRSEEGLDIAIRSTVLARMEDVGPYCSADGEVFSGQILTCVDAGYRTDAVYAAAAQIGKGIYPIMGFGKSAGCEGRASWVSAKKRTTELIPGDNWKLVRKQRIWLCEAYADHWKGWEHDRWRTGPDKPASMRLFGEAHEDGSRLSQDSLSHATYAKQICSEVEIEEPYKGGIRRRWKTVAKDNHYLDASCYCNVAASILGVRMTGSVAVKAPKEAPAVAGITKTRVPLRQMGRAQ